MNTVELLKLIKNTLEGVHSQSYYEIAPQNTTYPHVIYDLNIFKNELRHDATLTIDIWDFNTDAIPIETLTDSINKAFDMLNSPTDKVLPTFYLENRLSVSDTNQNIRHRQLRYTIQTYFN